jgi:Trk K+ transport system NAD-binding subunit
VPIIVYRVLRSLVQVRTWALPAGLMLFVFVTSWPLMWLVEPPEAAIVEPANYWWWFLVTAATVGYGDFFPVSPVGHVVGLYVIVGGIASLTTLFTRLVAAMETARGRRMKGVMTVDATGHIVLLGYTPGRTERILDELLAERDTRIVLCAWDEVVAHPLPERDIDFVRGDLTDEAVLRRAGVDRAEAVLVDARDDNEALALAVTVNHIAPTRRTIVALRDMARATQLGYVSDSIHCVQWHTPRMITEELQSPGISLVYADLMTHGGGNTYSMRLPDAVGSVAYGDCQVALGTRHDATVLAAHTGDALLVSPPWSTVLAPGAVLYYVSRASIAPGELVDALRHSRVVAQRTAS